jgi:hypothetical protein
MAFANFGILQAMPDPYERIRQASQGWGALPGVVGGIQQKWAEEKLKDVHGRVLGAWDYQHEADSNPQYQFASPEEKAQHEANRAIFKPGDTDSQKFRKAAQLYSPYDSSLTEKMLGMADVRDREEAQLQDEMNQRIAQQKANEEEAKAKLPYEFSIRGERLFDAYGSQIAELYQRRDKVNPNDVATLKLIDDAIRDKVSRQQLALEANKDATKGSPLESLYADPVAPVAPPVVAPQVAPVVVPEIILTNASDLEQKKLEVDQLVQAKMISYDEAIRRKDVLTVQAGKLSRREGAAASAKANAQAEEQKRLGVLVGSAKMLGENSVMMGAVEKVASGNLDDLSVNAMLAALPAENARMVGGLREKDDTILNTLRSKLGTDTEYTPEDKAALMDIAKRVQAGYNAKVQRLQQEWDKFSPAQQEQVRTDFSAFAPKTVQQSTKGDPLGIRR